MYVTSKLHTMRNGTRSMKHHPERVGKAARQRAVQTARAVTGRQSKRSRWQLSAVATGGFVAGVSLAWLLASLRSLRPAREPHVAGDQAPTGS